MTKMNPNKVKNPAVTAMLPPENRRFANTDTSSIGCELCRSHSANAVMTTTPTTKPIAVRTLLHPQFGASITVYTTAVTPTDERISPGMSTRGAAGSRDVGTNSQPPMIATAATGTLTRKIEPHEKCSSSQPPVIGPAATPTPTMAAHRPIALALVTGSVKMFVISPSVVGKITAAPIPIAARAAISASAELTCAATADVIANTASPELS